MSDFSKKDKRIVILMADDDREFFNLVSDAFEESGLNLDVDLIWVKDGEEAMDYLRRKGDYERAESSPRPDLILLDIFMPRKDGIETLKEIKDHPKLRKIPVAMLTSSRDQKLVSSSYAMGADMFLLKPYRLEEMMEAMRSLLAHWFNVVRLPEKGDWHPFSRTA